MPAVTDVKTPRPNRYIVMDFSNPAGGKEGEFEVALNQHIRDVLALPGWMAAQRYKLAPAVAGRGGRPNKPQYLTIWEVEAQNGQNVSQIQSALNEAVKAGKVKAVPIDETTWEFTYWEPITPYIRFEYDVTDSMNITAGEQVRWLPRRRASDLALPGNDFWVFDDRLVRFGHFAGDGTGLGHEMSDDPAVARLCATEAARTIGST